VPEEPHLYAHPPVSSTWHGGQLRGLPAEAHGDRNRSLLPVIALHGDRHGHFPTQRDAPEVLLIAALLHNPDLLLLENPSPVWIWHSGWCYAA